MLEPVRDRAAALPLVPASASGWHLHDVPPDPLQPPAPPPPPPPGEEPVSDPPAPSQTPPVSDPPKFV